MLTGNSFASVPSTTWKHTRTYTYTYTWARTRIHINQMRILVRLAPVRLNWIPHYPLGTITTSRLVQCVGARMVYNLIAKNLKWMKMCIGFVYRYMVCYQNAYQRIVTYTKWCTNLAQIHTCTTHICTQRYCATGISMTIQVDRHHWIVSFG